MMGKSYTVVCLLLLLAVMGCEKLQPASVQIPEYPDFGQLMEQQIAFLAGSSVRKRVWLGDTSETREITLDSAMWVEELAFLKESNPNQPEYVGAFSKRSENGGTLLALKAGERGPLKQVWYITDSAGYKAIRILFHEDKDVYVHHRDISLDFDRGVLKTLEIKGYQKMMFQDTVRFGIFLKKMP